jgi:hypothetical protein
LTLDFSPVAQLIVSGAREQAVKLWDAKTLHPDVSASVSEWSFDSHLTIRFLLLFD